MLNIGCHLSTTKGYENMGKEALTIDANTFQFFTRNPRGGKAKEINEEKASISIGRVMTCVLGMVVSREREIRNFVKTPFYKIVGNFGEEEANFNAEWKVNDKVWKNVTFIGNQYTIATENATESVQ